MRTSDKSWSGSLRVVGELERPDHFYLMPGDECYFLGEYTPRKNWTFSVTNQHIFNLKKEVHLRNTTQWPHKIQAIQMIGKTIAENLERDALRTITFVPIPPSKMPSHPEYDDRVTQIARAIAPAADVRDILVSSANRDPFHVGQKRRNLADLRATLQVQQHLLPVDEKFIVLLDDVLTTGCSFSVCKSMLLEHRPQATVIGMFVARRVIAGVD